MAGSTSAAPIKDSQKRKLEAMRLLRRRIAIHINRKAAITLKLKATGTSFIASKPLNKK
ncbi:hypothetical protein FACS189475_06190 [Betaproteobacteria bacterium]|nr:hypothetical protein FACS189475_06190 [Betaproteobacteria bacterium]